MFLVCGFEVEAVARYSQCPLQLSFPSLAQSLVTPVLISSFPIFKYIVPFVPSLCMTSHLRSGTVDAEQFLPLQLGFERFQYSTKF